MTITSKLLLTITLLASTAATAAAQTYDPVMVQAYYAALQIEHDDDESDDPIVRLRDAMQIMHDHGIYPPNYPPPSEINTDYAAVARTEGTGCFLYYDDEAGEWRERCSDYHTMRCNTQKQIDDLTSAMNGANFFTNFYGSAAFYAGMVGHIPARNIFTGLGLFFAWTSQYAESRLRDMEINRCPTP